MSDLIISGVVDGPLTGGLPKAIELTVLNDIQDLSIYSIGIANNGNGTDGEEFPLTGSASAGDRIYINSEDSDAFLEFLGFEPTFVSGFAAVNGDDAIELFQNGVVVDVFGDPDVDGSGQDWEYTDGWAYRNSNSVPNGGNFDDSEWTFSGPNALDGETRNFGAEAPVPIPLVYIGEPNSGINISENGISDTYEVVLNSQPTDTVIVTITPDAQTSLNGLTAGQPILLTFTPQNYNQVQAVTVSAVGNATDPRTITHTVTSNDPIYDSNSNSDVIINTNINSAGNENEIVINTLTTPGVTITESDGSTTVSEGGGITDTYEIVLNAEPSAEVTITVTPDAESGLDGGVAGEAITLTFTPENFSTPQIVTISAVSDQTSDGEHTSLITHTVSSSDPDYDQLTIDNVTATVLDTGITITEVTSDPNLEGSETTYKVILNTIPTDPVTVTVTPDAQLDLGAGAGEAIELFFDPDDVNFSQTQTVTATAIDTDASGEGIHIGTITHTATSDDTDYVVDSESAITVSLDITEPGISIVESDGGTTVSEVGISDQYDIVLNAIPTEPVTVTITPDAQTDLGDGPGVPIEVLFDPSAGDFSQTQTITVTAVDEGDGTRQASITHSATSDDPNYNSSTLPSVTPTIIDCFLTGTQVLTDAGEKRVEELKIGDRLQTLNGTLEKIKWIGIQTCYTHGHNHPLRTNPIRVKAGALGPNCPIRDLYVSPDHALLVEGILVNAGALENGDSIVQIQPTSKTFVYYHIELEQHNILIADGAPAESYLPQKQNRETFDNGDEYIALYPHSNIQALVPMPYPRVSSKRQLPRFISKHIEKHHRLQTV